MTRLLAVHPVSDENPGALPVNALDAAVAFYQEALGFVALHRDGESATVARDDVQIGPNGYCFCFYQPA